MHSFTPGTPRVPWSRTLRLSHPTVPPAALFRSCTTQHPGTKCRLGCWTWFFFFFVFFFILPNDLKWPRTKLHILYDKLLIIFKAYIDDLSRNSLIFPMYLLCPYILLYLLYSLYSHPKIPPQTHIIYTYIYDVYKHIPPLVCHIPPLACHISVPSTSRSFHEPRLHIPL